MESREVVGLVSLIITALSSYIFFLHRQFAAERKTYSEERKERNLEWQTIARDGNQIMREHASILSALKTLLENKK